jgi:hypothetical protein
MLLTDYNVKIGSQLVVVDPNGKPNALKHVNETTSVEKSEEVTKYNLQRQ